MVAPVGAGPVRRPRARGAARPPAPSGREGAGLLGSTDSARFATLRRSLDDTRRRGLYSPEFASRANGAALEYLEGAYDRASEDLLRAMSVTDIVTYLPEDLLVKVDRMSMAWALEARSPFLDTRVVELALAMPAWLKRDSAGGKRIVKQAFGGLFPAGFLERPKMGFSLPVDEWLRVGAGARWCTRASSAPSSRTPG